MLCAKALERGDIVTAYRLSDRRCRIRPLPEPHCFVLRAEALFRMGERAAAIEDLVTALRLAPDDLAANRRMLTWGKPAQRLAAAKVIVECERDTRILKQALAVLHNNGINAFATLQVRGDLIEGWACWQGAGEICVAIADEEKCIERLFDADVRHPLSGELGSAVAFRFAKEQVPQLISVSRNGDVLTELRTAGWDGKSLPIRKLEPAEENRDASVTVIVPVYADYRATKACLKALLSQLNTTHCAIIVNDASPDPRIHAMLAAVAGAAHVRVLTNARNLGFVGAVNRALKEVSSGDVVLLNSDTVVPKRFIERLASAAHSSSDIGTVTPLSNNGEFTSFPIPNRPNVICNGLDAGKIDRVAAQVNAGVVVNIPNGIGFCLYVTRSCLDAVGLLSDSYHRGYLEDVDFCLRARLHGFRNVCAASIYVVHAGSRSFGKQKRSLVVRNLKVVEQRFPAYRAECADFMLADPLAAARQAIEASLMPSCQHGVLLVTCNGAVATVARERARYLLAEELPAVLILEIHLTRGRIIAKLSDADDAVPQSLEFVLPVSGDATDLLRSLRQLSLKRIEFFDVGRTPLAVLDALLELSIPYDIFLAHTELGLEHASFQMRGQIVPNPLFCRDLVARAERVLVPDAQAEAAARSLSHRKITALASATAQVRRSSRRLHGPAARLGLVPVRECAQEHQFMREAIARLVNTQPSLDIIVAGSTHDDTDLMRAGAFVTGSIEAAELHRLFRRYQLDRILLCVTRPLFGHPVLSNVMASKLPVAYLDWSRGYCPVRDSDLPLDPTLSIETLVGCLSPWVEGHQIP